MVEVAGDLKEKMDRDEEEEQERQQEEQKLDLESMVFAQPRYFLITLSQ